MKLANSTKGRTISNKKVDSQKFIVSQVRNKSMAKKELNDYTYFMGTAKQVSEYETTTLFIINHIKKDFEFGNDIASALDELKEIDITRFKPRLRTSESESLSEKITEDKQYELEFKEEFSAYMKRKQCYDNNRFKAYAVIWERCAKGMQSKIESDLCCFRTQSRSLMIASLHASTR